MSTTHIHEHPFIPPPTPPIKLHIQLSKAAKVSGGVGIMCVCCVWNKWGVRCVVCGVWCVGCVVCGTCDDMICNLWNTVIKCGFFFLQWPISLSLWCFYASPFFFLFCYITFFQKFNRTLASLPLYIRLLQLLLQRVVKCVFQLCI